MTERPPTPRFIAPWENCSDEEPFRFDRRWFIPVWRVEDGTRTQWAFNITDDAFEPFDALQERIDACRQRVIEQQSAALLRFND